MNKNYSISIIRVLAMISIIIGHFLSMIGINHFQFGAIGVEIFLFISGWLYSEKRIENSKKWLIQRWKRLIIPYWIVLFFLILLQFVNHYKIDIQSIILFFLNLQGINKVFTNIAISPISGIGQTWFLTVLMICYGIMLLFKKNSKVENYIRGHRIEVFACSFIIQICFALIHVQLIKILCFFYGYFWNKETAMEKKNYLLITLLMLIFIIIRFVTHIYYDETIFYNNIIFGWSFIFLAIWLIISFFIVCNKFLKFTKAIANNTIWKLLDFLSYFLFLTHYMFLSGNFAVITISNNIFIQLFLLLIFSTLLSLVVAFMTDNRRLIRIFKNC